jgi:HNH endonuclease
MPRFFTHYWLNRTWERNRRRASDGELLDHTAGNLFQERGIRAGDIVYVVSVVKGSLYVCGKLMVEQICGTNEAAAILGYEPWPAEEHIIAAAATPMNFNLRVPLKLTRQLIFISGKDNKPLKFKAPNYLDEQTLRGVRELAPESAADLDNLLPPLEEISFDKETFPEEVIDAQTYYEGATKHITVNVYERSAKARRVCIARYGLGCFICGFNFKSVYGEAGDGFIHVHHLKPLSEVSEEYELDPVKDLRPVCPNCHAMIHKKTPAYTIEEMKELLSQQVAQVE